jgi:hypothetical protein
MHVAAVVMLTWEGGAQSKDLGSTFPSGIEPSISLGFKLLLFCTSKLLKRRL